MQESSRSGLLCSRYMRAVRATEALEGPMAAAVPGRGARGGRLLRRRSMKGRRASVSKEGPCKTHLEMHVPQNIKGML